jgi:hypothetical protein
MLIFNNTTSNSISDIFEYRSGIARRQRRSARRSAWIWAIVLAKLLGQRIQRYSWACLGKSGQRIVTVLTSPLIEAGLPVPCQAPPSVIALSNG